MNEPAQLDLIQMFRVFLMYYPSMRFGQAVCAVTGWGESDDPAEVSDESLKALLMEYLERQFENNAFDVTNSSMSDDLASLLWEARRLQPSLPFGKLIVALTAKNGWNIYDTENDALIVALQADNNSRLKILTRGQPITA